MAPSSVVAEERAVTATGDIVQKTPKRRWVSYIWDTFDKSPEERRLLFKLDLAILTFASLGYFIKYLDQININNAFVSGMKEDLGMYGNQLNYMQTCWTVGYVIGEIPSNVLLTRIRPRYWIPAMEVLVTMDDTDFFIVPMQYRYPVLCPTILYCSKAVGDLEGGNVALSQKRMQLEGRKNREPYTKSKLKKIFTSWHVYLLTVLYITFNNGGAGSQPVFQQWLKASTNPKYSVGQINAYPTTTSAVQVVTTLAYAWSSDTFLNGKRWPPIIFGAIINIICYVSLAVWDIPTGWKWTCFILAGAGYGLSGLCMAWAHEICSEDNEERSLVIGSMNEMAYVFQAWLPQVVWQQIDAPQYRKGYIAVTILSVILIGTTVVIRELDLREQVAKAKRRQVESEESIVEVEGGESGQEGPGKV
ncbi:hypothetical protein ETB97_000421 [Aspergillus alliaceus]|uniref:Pantothenate transporter liz1 n=1 Tax=Petromyces alliaceus TaxID=209559 RepID=A0A8H6A7K2_PETAA|nr:hypothetical protein ETB97_000421 [Aspergillus burnettii]